MNLTQEQRKEIAQAAKTAHEIFRKHFWFWGTDSRKYTPSEGEIALAFYHQVESVMGDDMGDGAIIRSGRLAAMRDDDGAGGVHLFIDIGMVDFEEES